MSALQPLILTVKLEQSAFEFFDRLRKQYFPPERNFIPAHITLFHALPGARAHFVRETLTEICGETVVFPLNFKKPLFLGKGTAIEIESQPLAALRRRLAEVFADDLTRQDQQTLRPHITVQNKVAPDTARNLYDQFLAEWQPFSADAEGLLLWEYQGGPWRLIAELAFARKAREV